MTLLELLQLLKKHLGLVIALPVVCAIATGVVAYGFMANTYTAKTSLYVLAQDDSTTSLQTSLSAGQLIANDVAALIKSDEVALETAKILGLENLSDYDITVSSQTTNRIISLSVEGKDPWETAEVTSTLVDVTSSLAKEVMHVEAVNKFGSVDVPQNPTGPKRAMYIAVAFLAGLFVAVAIVVLLDMLNTKIRTAEDVEELLGVPVIGRMPALKGGK